MFYARFNSALTRLQERFVWHSRGQKPKKGKVGSVQAERCKEYENRTFQLQFSPTFARVSEIPSKNHVWASLGLLGPPDPLLGPPRSSSVLPRNLLGTSSQLPRSSSVLLGTPRFSPVLPGPPLCLLVSFSCFCRGVRAKMRAMARILATSICLQRFRRNSATFTFCSRFACLFLRLTLLSCMPSGPPPYSLATPWVGQLYASSSR